MHTYSHDDHFVITGATSGIGFETTKALLSAGASVIAIGRNPEKLNTLNCSNLHFIEMDFTNPDDVENKVKQLVKNFQNFKGCVLAAGTQFILPFSACKMSKMANLININLLSNLAVAKIFSNKRIISKDGASVVFVSSISSFRGSQGVLPYAASKAAMNASMKCLALELSKNNVRVNALLPGLVRTELLEKHSNVYTKEYLEKANLEYPLGIGEICQVIEPILFLLSSKASWITGSEIVVDGGTSI